MLLIRSERLRRTLQFVLPFAVMPAVLLLPKETMGQYYAFISFVMVLCALLAGRLP